HRAAILTAGTFAALLLLATMAITWQASRATKAEAAARISRVLRLRGRIDAEALEMLRSASEDLTRLEGPDHLDTLESRNYLALACLAAGHTAESIALLEPTLKAWEPKFGPDHPDTQAIRTNLAEAYLAAGRTSGAIALLEPMLKAQEVKLGPEHPYSLISRNKLAAAYLVAGRAAEAIALHEATPKPPAPTLPPPP